MKYKNKRPIPNIIESYGFNYGVIHDETNNEILFVRSIDGRIWEILTSDLSNGVLIIEAGQYNDNFNEIYDFTNKTLQICPAEYDYIIKCDNLYCIIGEHEFEELFEKME